LNLKHSLLSILLTTIPTIASATVTELKCSGDALNVKVKRETEFNVILDIANEKLFDIHQKTIYYWHRDPSQIASTTKASFDFATPPSSEYVKLNYKINSDNRDVELTAKRSFNMDAKKTFYKFDFQVNRRSGGFNLKYTYDLGEGNVYTSYSGYCKVEKRESYNAF
jgi:hypothetical protein